MTETAPLSTNLKSEKVFEDSENLPELFTSAEDNMKQLDEQTVVCPQKLAVDVIKQFETATKFVSILGLFSRNEKIDEVATSDLRYLLLPAHLAKLTLKLYDHRLERLKAAEIYMKDFFRRCRDYEVPGSNMIPERVLTTNAGQGDENTHQGSLIPKGPQAEIVEATRKRAAKIAALKQKMESQERAAQLKKKIDSGTADEEIEREYYYSLINTNILELLDELTFVEEEKRLLEHREKLAAGEVEEEEPIETPVPKGFTKIEKPIMIVRNELQKHVFGAGYPSLPLLTVDEFYKELVEEGALPAPGSKAAANLNYMGPTQDELEADDVKKERDIEKDDPEYLRNARDYDDWKDDHKRGWGNRIGQG